MEYRIIKSPSQGTIDILCPQKGSGTAKPIGRTDAIGLGTGQDD